MTENYEVVAFRDGKSWTFEIPALTAPSPRGAGHRIVAMGQARTAAEIADESRDVVALWLDVDDADIEVQVVYRLPDTVRQSVDRARELDTEGRAALEEAARLRREVVRSLRSSGMSQADSAAVLGMSRQRVQQLEAAQ